MSYTYITFDNLLRERNELREQLASIKEKHEQFVSRTVALVDEINELREQLALVKVALPDIKFGAWLLRHASKQKVNEHRSMADSASIITQHIERIEESFKKNER